MLITPFWPVRFFFSFATLAVFYFRSRFEKLITAPNIKKVHWVQALVHTSVYLYWGHYYSGVREHLPYIIYQIAFGHIFNFLASIILQKPYKIDFSIFPIVLSINLFIWFKHEFFYWQLLMVASAILGKILLTREVRGRKAHIFNPSALVMFAIAMCAIFLPIQDELNVLSVVRSFALIPHFYIFLYIVGSITLWFSETNLITVGAVLTMLIGDYLSQKNIRHATLAISYSPQCFSWHDFTHHRSGDNTKVQGYAASFWLFICNEPRTGFWHSFFFQQT